MRIKAAVLSLVDRYRHTIMCKQLVLNINVHV